jgi:hypothetical protein
MSEKRELKVNPSLMFSVGEHRTVKLRSILRLAERFGVARDDMGRLFYDLNDYVQPATAGHRIEIINRQFLGFVFVGGHVHLLLCLEGATPSQSVFAGVRGAVRLRSFVRCINVFCLIKGSFGTKLQSNSLIR